MNETDFNPKHANRAALDMIRAGEYGDAVKTLKQAVAMMPPSSLCFGEAAQDRFRLLSLLAWVTKK